MSIIVPVSQLYGSYFSKLPATSKSSPGTSKVVISNQKSPTDALYLADVTLIGPKIGSQYRLEMEDGTELAGGIVDSNPYIISNVSAYSSPQLMLLKLRHASGEIKYLPYTSNAYHNKEGAIIFCSQSEDKIAG